MPPLPTNVNRRMSLEPKREYWAETKCAGHKNIHTYDHGENLMLQSPRKPKKNSDLEQVTDKLSMLLVLNTPWNGSE